MIQEVRADIYELHRYLMQEDVLCSVAHPLYRINGRLTIDHLEKLLLLFPRFEAINGARDRRSAELVEAVFRHLTPELIAQMADRHGLEPCGPEPWKKVFTGGSDDHSGCHIASAYTTTTYARDVTEFLGALAAGRPRGGWVLRRQCDHGAWPVPHRVSYYKDRFLRGSDGGKPSIIGELFRKLLEGTSPQPQPAGLGSASAIGRPASFGPGKRPG